VDLFPYVKEHYTSKLKSFSLKSVASFFDPETPKIDLNYTDMMAHFCSGDPDRRGIVAEYCVRDCVIPATLCDRLDVFVNLLELSRVTGVPASQITKRGQQVRCVAQLYRVCCRRGMVMNIRKQRQSDTYRGAIVQEPKKGYYQNVIIYEDFASLYPNIMRSYNLSYDTYVYPEDLDDLQRHVTTVAYPMDATDRGGFLNAHNTARAACGRGEVVLRAFPIADGKVHHFIQALEGPLVGVVPELLNDILMARKRAKAAMKAAPDAMSRRVQNARQLSLKITANSMYGFTGVPADIAMIPLSAVAETTTAMGRYLISMCANMVPSRFPVRLIYGDTDSVLFETDTADVARGHAIGMEVEQWLNRDILPAYGSYLSIECEEVCSPYLQIMKKRYISRAFDNGTTDGHVEYKGIELVRKDSLPFCRRLYAGIIDLVFGAGIAQGPAKTKEEVARDIVTYLSQEFTKVNERDATYGVADFATTKTLQNRSRYKVRSPGGMIA